MEPKRNDWPVVAVLGVLMVLVCAAWALDVHTHEPVAKEEGEGYRLPVILQTMYETGDSQEMRFITAWTKAFERSELVRPGVKDEPHLWVVATIIWDQEAERLAVMIEAMFMFPELGGLAFKTYSRLDLLEARDIGKKQHHNGVLERILDVTQEWMRLAIPVFEAIAQPCPQATVLHTKGVTHGNKSAGLS